MTSNPKGKEMLGLAIEIAVDAHRHQVDKGGLPYILHPLHLMNQLLFDVELAIIAVLHDVVEDSSWSIDMLIEQGFSHRVITALALLTHHPDDDYDCYIDKIATNLDAILVKRKDLEHNTDITRLKGLRPKDLERMAKYHRAFIRLGEAKHTQLEQRL
ncbi:MAG: GTP pyrophosphokinase [Pseudomonadales bacterium]